MLRILACALALSSLPLAAAADWRLSPEAPIATDRPGNGNAATTVTRGHLNLEASALYAHPARARVHQLSLPFMLRLGVLERLELRAGSGVVGFERSGDQSDVSATDTSAGLKVSALDNRGAQPALAFSADVFLPSGQGAFTAGTTLPEVRALAAWSLPRSLGLLLNAGGDVPQDSAGTHYLRVLWVANVGYAPTGLRGRLNAFVELFGRHGLGAGSEQILQLDWGMSGLLNDDLQLDFYFQHGLSDDAPKLQLSVGVSARF